MTFQQRLVRKRPELMRRWQEDKGTCSIQVADDLRQRAIVAVRLQFGDGRVERIELPVF
jgi:hypothetical protein